MAPQKVMKLAFITSFSSCGPTSSLSQRLMNLHLSQVTASRYCTASENCQRRAEDGQTMKNSHENRGKAKILVIAGSFITIIGGYFMYHSKERKAPTQAISPPHREEVIIDTTIKEPFSLMNHKGEAVTDRDLKGQWTLIYFGYTSCPDDCPEELQKVADVVRTIEKETGEKMTPIFITLDPNRDSPAQLQAYLSEFHPRFIGLTGTADEIQQIAREYRVFYKIVDDEGSDYLVDHSNLIYLMNPDVEFVKLFGKEYKARTLSVEVISEMKKHDAIYRRDH